MVVATAGAVALVMTALVPAPVSAAPAVTDPIYPVDFPDPSVVRVGATTYAYATNGPGGNVQVIRSGDLRSWARLPDALPRLPSNRATRRNWSRS